MNPLLVCYFFIFVSAMLDIGANLLMEKSEGFKHKRFGVPALGMVCLAYTLLAQVTRVMDLTVAYVSWGAMAILGSTLAGSYFLGQKLNWKGGLGILMVFTSIILLKTA